MAMPLLYEVHYREDIVLYRPEVLATSPMAGINSLLTGKKLRPYDTMRWVCVLFTSNIPKREKHSVI